MQNHSSSQNLAQPQTPELINSPEGIEITTPRLFKRITIVSGGQTGVDRAVMDFALDFGIPCHGWCPQGRAAEDGVIDSKYPLQQTSSAVPAVRTELNVLDSDATVVMSWGVPSDGTKLMQEFARNYNKPFYYIDISEPDKIDVSAFRKWVEENQLVSINIGGPRESFAPGMVYVKAMDAMKILFLK